ncbi:unnamed protein product [Symbiodinium microadriaticum]|nr:unnamed protein product [Symbiodinium microadriaticum]
MKGYAYQVQEETDIETDMQGYAGQLLAQAIAKRQEAGENVVKMKMRPAGSRKGPQKVQAPARACS